MTIQDAVNIAGEYPLILITFFTAPALIAWLLSIRLKSRYLATPWKLLFSLLTYIVCVPGIFSVVLVAYTVFFKRGDLLQVNILVYFLPLISMIVTLSGINKTIKFDDIPGFDRLSGLMTTIAITFAIVLGIEKTRIWIGFHGPIWLLLGIAAVLFILLKASARKLFGGADKGGRPNNDSGR